MTQTKIRSEHLSRPAIVYIRQSSLAQVRFHRESTERQYALQEKALNLGWPQELIQVIDEDLGISGSGRSQRQGFQTLVAKVSMGEVGAIFGLEISRLARSSADLLRLLELCGLFNTIVADDDGVYDLSDFNDRLILGFKGTMSEAELHFLHSRMQGGRRNKAQKGELRRPLPIGYVYDSNKQIAFDPDEGVQTALRNVFSVFKAVGSAYGVVRHFLKNGLQIPKRLYGGAWDVKLIWGGLTHSRVMDILHNPCYAGIYAYGRYKDKKSVTPDGIFVHHRVTLPQDQWPICIPDRHPAYITQDEYEENIKKLRGNRANFNGIGAAREGAALLQGLVICGQCGRRMAVRYCGDGGVKARYECRRQWEHSEKTNCGSVLARIVDDAVVQRLITAMQPANLELAVQVMDNLLKRDNDSDKSWKLALERAEYDAGRAERQYSQVEPENRLVARNLETQWNDKLAELERLRKEYNEYKAQRDWVPTENDKAEILSLANELPQVWNDPNITAKDRKRILRTLIEDVTIFTQSRQPDIRLGLRWRNNCCEELHAFKQKPISSPIKHTPQTVEQVRLLAATTNDTKIADHLNASGMKPPFRQSFTKASITQIRQKHNIPAFTSRIEGFSVTDVAKKFDVGRDTVYYWIERGVVNAHKAAPGCHWDISLDDKKCEELYEWVRNSGHLNKIKSVAH